MRRYLAFSMLSMLSTLLTACAADGEVGAPLSPSRPLALAITPAPGALEMCNWVQLGVVMHDHSGAIVALDSARWTSSSDTSMAVVLPNGRLTSYQGVGVDTVRATAWHGGEAASAQAIWLISEAAILYCDADGKCHGPICPPHS